jgi:undecaprenyl diphosphate synthase
MIASNLYCPSIPPIDIMIRTSGEQRISNFMLWRIAYSELYFIDKHWPDFNNKDLDDVITEFCKRQRRFGK